MIELISLLISIHTTRTQIVGFRCVIYIWVDNHSSKELARTVFTIFEKYMAKVQDANFITY